MTFIVGRGCVKLQILKNKSGNGPVSWTERNIMANCNMHIDIDKV